MADVRRFELVQTRIPDATRPGKWIKNFEWQKCSDTALSIGGKVYHPDKSGWFDIPDEHAQELTKAAAWMTRVKAAGTGISDVDDYDDDEEAKPTRRRKASGES